MRDTETHGQRQQKINQTQNFASLMQKMKKLYKLKIYLRQFLELLYCTSIEFNENNFSLPCLKFVVQIMNEN